MIDYIKLAKTSRKAFRFVESKERYLENLELAEKLSAEANTTDSRQSLCDTYIALGDICKVEDNNEEAKDWYLKSLKIAEQLAAESNSSDPCRNLCDVYLGLGYLSSNTGKLKEAKN